MPALLGGLFIGVLSALPIISCCCCLWMFGGGVLAAYLKSQSRPTALSMGEGATIGLLAGAVVTFVLTLCVVSVLSTIGGMVGAAYFKRDVPPALGGPINPPPLPGN